MRCAKPVGLNLLAERIDDATARRRDDAHLVERLLERGVGYLED